MTTFCFKYYLMYDLIYDLMYGLRYDLMYDLNYDLMYDCMQDLMYVLMLFLKLLLMYAYKMQVVQLITNKKLAKASAISFGINMDVECAWIGPPDNDGFTPFGPDLEKDKNATS